MSAGSDTDGFIPFVDLLAQHEEVKQDIVRSWESLLADARFILGPEVERFEQEFARFCDASHCVGVGSGTDALELSLRALSIGPGDEVVVPTNSFVATAFAVLRAGAHPVFVDVDPDRYLLDASLAIRAFTPRTRAVVAVHLYGQVAPVDELADACSERGIHLIHDAAQAHGARRDGLALGRLPGSVAAFSFYPSKNLGAYGDAGCVITDSSEHAETVRALRNWGRIRDGESEHLGFNSRLDGLQACVLSAKLPRLDAWNLRRREAAELYHRLLASDERIKLPDSAPENEHVWHLYVIEVERRDEVQKAMEANGIRTGIHYPVPIHLSTAFRHLDYRRGDFPIAEKASGRILSLPMHPHITVEVQHRVVDVLRRAIDGR